MSGASRKLCLFFEEAFRLSKDTLTGADHPDTLFIMGNLADVYRETGQLEKGIPLAEETFKLQRASLGPDHLDTLTTAHNRGAYHDAGRAAEALSLADETYKLRAAKLGPNHPDTLKTLNNLAGFHESADDLDKAIPLFEKSARRNPLAANAWTPPQLRRPAESRTVLREKGERGVGRTAASRARRIATKKCGRRCDRDGQFASTARPKFGQTAEV